jgi:putative DNA primase/helicase
MLLKGSGANGKSVFMKVVAALHSQVASLRLNELHSFHLMPLVGASLVVVDEVPRFGINEQMLKTLISGEAVTIDRKHRDPIGYTPTAKWIIATNNDQKMQDNSFGLWRRLVTIPFNQQIAGGAVVPGLDRLIIENELNFFLDWCLIGLQRLLRRGSLPPEPECVVTAKRSAIEASNSVAAWSMHEEVATSAECSAEKQSVYDDYRNWCQSQGLRAVSGNVFWKELKELHPALVDEQRRVAGGSRQRFVNLVFSADASSEQINPFTTT